MKDKSKEICINIWCIVDSDSRLIYRMAARGYVLSGSDDEKARTLKELASFDYHLAKDFPIPEKYKTSIVDEMGQEKQVAGIGPEAIDLFFPDLLDGICKEIEKEFPSKVIFSADEPRMYKMKIPENPYCVRTYLLEDGMGNLKQL